jgi:hypothetical protein
MAEGAAHSFFGSKGLWDSIVPENGCLLTILNHLTAMDVREFNWHLADLINRNTSDAAAIAANPPKSATLATIVSPIQQHSMAHDQRFFPRLSPQASQN